MKCLISEYLNVAQLVKKLHAFFQREVSLPYDHVLTNQRQLGGLHGDELLVLFKHCYSRLIIQYECTGNYALHKEPLSNPHFVHRTTYHD
jgi:hypothetical protein